MNESANPSAGPAPDPQERTLIEDLRWWADMREGDTTPWGVGLRSLLRQAADTLADLTAVRAQHETMRAEMKQAGDTFTTENQALHERIEELEADLTAIRAQLEAIQQTQPAEVVDAYSEIARLQAALTALRAERDASEPQPVDNSTIGSLKAAMLRLLKDDTDLRAELAEALRAIGVMPTPSQAGPAPDPQERLEFQRGRADKWLSIASKRATEIEDLKANVEELETDLAAVRAQLADCPVDELRAALTALRAQLDDLPKRWEAKGDQVDTFHATMGVGYHMCADELRARLAVLDGEP